MNVLVNRIRPHSAIPAGTRGVIKYPPIPLHVLLTRTPFGEINLPGIFIPSLAYRAAEKPADRREDKTTRRGQSAGHKPVCGIEHLLHLRAPEQRHGSNKSRRIGVVNRVGITIEVPVEGHGCGSDPHDWVFLQPAARAAIVGSGPGRVERVLCESGLLNGDDSR